CHAGGMTRGVDARLIGDVRYRTEGRYDIEGDLQGVVPFPTAITTLEVPHVVFLAAAQYHELVPEIMINGRYHGALSFAFASSLSGLADSNQDGVITGAELSSYVLRTIRVISESTQNPSVRWPTPDARSGVDMRPDQALFLRKPTAFKPGTVPSATVRLR